MELSLGHGCNYSSSLECSGSQQQDSVVELPRNLGLAGSLQTRDWMLGSFCFLWKVIHSFTFKLEKQYRIQLLEQLPPCYNNVICLLICRNLPLNESSFSIRLSSDHFSSGSDFHQSVNSSEGVREVDCGPESETATCLWTTANSCGCMLGQEGQHLDTGITAGQVRRLAEPVACSEDWQGVLPLLSIHPLGAQMSPC